MFYLIEAIHLICNKSDKHNLKAATALAIFK
jgi:hypothetical protein